MQKGGGYPLNDVESIGFLLWSFFSHISNPANEARRLIILSDLTPRLIPAVMTQECIFGGFAPFFISIQRTLFLITNQRSQPNSAHYI
jgi:hypothetical protein